MSLGRLVLSGKKDFTDISNKLYLEEYFKKNKRYKNPFRPEKLIF